jgi:hypothetical protein
MKNLSALSLPVAITLALVSGASTAQDRPNTTLVQKSKTNVQSLSKADKNIGQSTAQPSGASGRVDGKRITPTATQTAPATEAVQHDCHGQGSDA